MKVEILYTAWNRLEFTKFSFGLLKANTNWNRVQRLVVYDDLSEDGTREWLEEAGRDIMVPGFEVRTGGWHSTGATLNDYVARLGIDAEEPEAFIKIDNDIAMPLGWLPRLLVAASRHPEYDLVGIEAGWPEHGGDTAASVTRATHIGGVGLMRVDAFARRKPVPLALGKNGRAGFTIWQHRHSLKAGWLTPTMYAVQLDRIPEDPWASLSAHYVEQGWARSWDPYERDMANWWEWLPKEVPA